MLRFSHEEVGARKSDLWSTTVIWRVLSLQKNFPHTTPHLEAQPYGLGAAEDPEFPEGGALGV